ncbi:hypothetical protein CU102_00090 [Phyllobacterium brassicacearum]|uniref:Uncharacterized protein n=2 Tax=Phyllobacterium brassicacearum TaxID=314235 RepID=A0A2P7BVL5_9HYPH|nr:hypothetical protein CU102_00090 [Phyllobacterium brassicacearum]
MEPAELTSYLIVIGCTNSHHGERRMPTPTVPQDVYQRHEREWQVLREAIAKTQKSDKEAKKKIEIPQDRPQWDFKHKHQ